MSKRKSTGNWLLDSTTAWPAEKTESDSAETAQATNKPSPKEPLSAAPTELPPVTIGSPEPPKNSPGGKESHIGTTDNSGWDVNDDPWKAFIQDGAIETHDEEPDTPVPPLYEPSGHIPEVHESPSAENGHGRHDEEPSDSESTVEPDSDTDDDWFNDAEGPDTAAAVFAIPEETHRPEEQHREAAPQTPVSDPFAAAEIADTDDGWGFSSTSEETQESGETDPIWGSIEQTPPPEDSADENAPAGGEWTELQPPAAVEEPDTGFDIWGEASTDSGEHDEETTEPSIWDAEEPSDDMPAERPTAEQRPHAETEQVEPDKDTDPALDTAEPTEDPSNPPEPEHTVEDPVAHPMAESLQTEDATPTTIWQESLSDDPTESESDEPTENLQSHFSLEDFREDGEQEEDAEALTLPNDAFGKALAGEDESRTPNALVEKAKALPWKRIAIITTAALLSIGLITGGVIIGGKMMRDHQQQTEQTRMKDQLSSAQSAFTKEQNKLKLLVNEVKGSPVAADEALKEPLDIANKAISLKIPMAVDTAKKETTTIREATTKLTAIYNPLLQKSASTSQERLDALLKKANELNDAPDGDSKSSMSSMAQKLTGKKVTISNIVDMNKQIDALDKSVQETQKAKDDAAKAKADQEAADAKAKADAEAQAQAQSQSQTPTQKSTPQHTYTAPRQQYTPTQAPSTKAPSTQAPKTQAPSGDVGIDG